MNQVDIIEDKEVARPENSVFKFVYTRNIYELETVDKVHNFSMRIFRCVAKDLPALSYQKGLTL